MLSEHVYIHPSIHLFTSLTVPKVAEKSDSCFQIRRGGNRFEQKEDFRCPLTAIISIYPWMLSTRFVFL